MRDHEEDVLYLETMADQVYRKKIPYSHRPQKANEKREGRRTASGDDDVKSSVSSVRVTYVKDN